MECENMSILSFYENQYFRNLNAETFSDNMQLFQDSFKA